VVNRAEPDLIIGGADPLDTRLSDAGGGAARGAWWRRTRPALGLAPAPMPAFALLLCGIAVGPSGLAVLSPRLLNVLGPAVSIGLTALGLLIGLSLALENRRAARQLIAGWLEAGVTMIVVGGAVALTARFSLVDAALPVISIALIAICAAPSAATVNDTALDDELSGAADAAHYGDVLAILLGGFVVMWLAEPSASAMLWLALNVTGIAAAAAVAGWLLVDEAATESEQRVFAAGTLLLLGGAAVYLASPAIFIGGLAGVVWNLAGGRSRDRIARDVRYVQHPLIVMLLIVAGASIEISAEVFALGLFVAICRLGGKLVGARVASRVLVRDGPRESALQLVSPGLVGVALALSVTVPPGESNLPRFLLSVTVAATLVSDVIALLVAPDEGMV